MVVHGGHLTTKPRGAEAMRRSTSHLRVLRTSACICAKTLFFLTVPCSAQCPQDVHGGNHPRHDKVARHRTPAPPAGMTGRARSVGA
jgi:hypothetical protein